MFGFLKRCREIGKYARRKRASEKIRSQYTGILQQIDGFDGEEGRSFAVGVRQNKILFSELAPDVKAFSKSSHEEKARVLNELTKSIEESTRYEKLGLFGAGTCSGLQLVQLYCAAICWGDFNLADEIAGAAMPWDALGEKYLSD